MDNILNGLESYFKNHRVKRVVGVKTIAGEISGNLRNSVPILAPFLNDVEQPIIGTVTFVGRNFHKAAINLSFSAN